MYVGKVELKQDIVFDKAHLGASPMRGYFRLSKGVHRLEPSIEERGYYIIGRPQYKIERNHIQNLWGKGLIIPVT